MASVQFIKDLKGWILTTEKVHQKCYICAKPLSESFNYCKEKEWAMHKKCDLRTFDVCGLAMKFGEHIHYNIERQQQELQ